MKITRSILVFLLLVVFPHPAQAQYSTPGTLAVQFESEAFELGTYGELTDVAGNYNYDYVSYQNLTLTDSPAVTIDNLYAIFTRGNGPMVYIKAHTLDNWYEVNPYKTVTARDLNLPIFGSRYNVGDIASATHFDASGKPVYYVIGVTESFVQDYLHGQNAFVMQAGCEGAQNTLQFAYQTTGLSAYVGYTVPMQNSDIDRSINTMFSRMMSPVARTVNQAVNGGNGVSQIDSRMYAYDPNGTVLAPIVKSTSYDRQPTISGARTDTIYFDCRMQQSLSPVIDGSDGLTVTNAHWISATTLVFNDVPKYKGPLTATVYATNARSVNGIVLDGNQDPFPGADGIAPGWDDRICSVTSTTGGDNPLSTLSIFRVEDAGNGVHIRMMTELEVGSRSFFVQRSATATGPFTEVVSWPASTSHQYTCDDPSGHVGDWYEAWEIDSAGVRTRLDSKVAVSPIQYTPDVVITPSAGDSLVVAMLQEYPTPKQSMQPEQVLPIFQWVAIIPDETYRSAIQPLVNMHNADGLMSAIYTMAEVTSQFGSIQNLSKAWYPYGLRFILRVGDASNELYHNNPTYYVPYGCSYYPYGSQPQYDIMPVHYVLDPSGHILGSTTYLTPDMPKVDDGDIDGDGLNEVAEGIFPAHTPAEAAVMSRKMQKYRLQTAPASRHMTGYIDERTLNGNNGANAKTLADSIATAARKQFNVTLLVNDDVLNLPYSTRQSMAASDITSLPVMIMPFGVTTTRANWAFLNKLEGFSWSQTSAVSLYPFLSGWSCDLADFDRAEDVVNLPYNSRPIFEDAMLDTLHGPICGIGATRGTFIRGDFYGALTFNDIVLRHGAPSAGEAFDAAQHKIMTQHPEYAFQYQGYVYFGDPAAIIPGMVVNATTGVGGRDEAQVLSMTAPYPNPVRGSAMIRYTLPINTKVTLSVIDVQGRVVHEVVSEVQSVGAHAVRFTSDVNPGMYFLRLQAGSTTRTEKMVVIR